MMYCFGRCDKRLGKWTLCWDVREYQFDKLSEAEDFDPSYRDASFFGSTAGSFLKHAPWVNNMMQALPMWIAESIHPAMASFVAQKRASSHHFHNLHLYVNPSIGQPRTNQVHTSWTQRRTQRQRSPHNLRLNPRQQTSRARKTRRPALR